jgi:hypothetical protein
MSDQHALQPDADLPPDEDNSILEAVEGRADLVAEADPDGFAPEVELDDVENPA